MSALTTTKANEIGARRSTPPSLARPQLEHSAKTGAVHRDVAGAGRVAAEALVGLRARRVLVRRHAGARLRVAAVVTPGQRLIDARLHVARVALVAVLL